MHFNRTLLAASGGQTVREAGGEAETSMRRQLQEPRERRCLLDQDQGSGDDRGRSVSRYRLSSETIKCLFPEKWKQLASSRVFWGQESLRPGWKVET